MTVAANIGVYAATAIGLNIVVGLAGLLDLGYVAFLGIGAFMAANLSGAAAAKFDVARAVRRWSWWSPRWSRGMFGAIVGSPTLRVRGDYLAIVTLAFGEIFVRTAQNNIGGLTGGSNAIPGIPQVVLFGTRFSDRIAVGGLQLPAGVLYYVLIVFLVAFVMLVFSHLKESRLGGRGSRSARTRTPRGPWASAPARSRSWRSSCGATLAGFAGAFFAHKTGTVSYESFRFTESVTLLAAVILGGMGTVPGAVLGASVLFVLPEKLREFSEYRLLLFGLALILIMRFRPQGLIPDRHRRAELAHDPADEPPPGGIAGGAADGGAGMTPPPPPHAGRTGDGPILAASGVTMQFGGLRALGDVSFDLMEGQIIGLIGPNGAGKTTLFNCLTGLYAPTSGSVSLRGEQLPQDPALVTEKGIARTFQNIRLFPSMTAEENVLVGRHVRMKQSPLSSLLHGPKFKRSEAAARERSGELLNFVGLGRFSDELARNLPYGDQRRLEIARALATDPSVLLLDEPTAGMNAQETEATRQLIFAIRDLGISVVVIEHDTKFIFTLCDRVLVLVQGELLVEGSPDEVRGDPRVVEAYLGAPPEEVEAQLHSSATVDESPGGAHREEEEP